ncbi:hypothetical protein MSG28_006909 [Choristoneura fumiferana]|uniref:Uncharacterized protein n=1 Tax=Choristoneura fumiferana TaxID=7141 RepID=A0ACC0JLX7_CHOFU|nr:hypothetical protein MSG28_006909 [Choristoneura fumiferana]
MIVADPSWDSQTRINVLTTRLADLRKAYHSVKAELAAIDRRRKKLRRKEREGNKHGESSEGSVFMMKAVAANSHPGRCPTRLSLFVLEWTDERKLTLKHACLLKILFHPIKVKL